MYTLFSVINMKSFYILLFWIIYCSCNKTLKVAFLVWLNEWKLYHVGLSRLKIFNKIFTKPFTLKKYQNDSIFHYLRYTAFPNLSVKFCCLILDCENDFWVLFLEGSDFLCKKRNHIPRKSSVCLYNNVYAYIE